MLLTRVRVRPWRAFESRSSSGRRTTSWPSSCSMTMGSTTVWDSVPFGPFTVTSLPLMLTSTPDGTGIGSLPMRDMLSSLPLPDVGEDFPTYALLLALLVGAQPRRGGDDRHPEPTEHARQVGRLRVDPQAGLRDAPNAGDRPLAVLAELERDRHRLAGSVLVVLDGPAGDVALLL